MRHISEIYKPDKWYQRKIADMQLNGETAEKIHRQSCRRISENVTAFCEDHFFVTVVKFSYYKIGQRKKKKKDYEFLRNYYKQEIAGQKQEIAEGTHFLHLSVNE